MRLALSGELANGVSRAAGRRHPSPGRQLPNARQAFPAPKRRASLIYIGITPAFPAHTDAPYYPSKRGRGEFSTGKKPAEIVHLAQKMRPFDKTEKIKKKIRSFLLKNTCQIARRCDRISLGCKRLVRYKSCRPAICVDAGGCHPAIAAMGYFRGVCPILEPGEKITDSDGIRSLGREVTPLRNGRNQCSDLIC